MSLFGYSSGFGEGAGHLEPSSQCTEGGAGVMGLSSPSSSSLELRSVYASLIVASVMWLNVALFANLLAAASTSV